MERTGRLRGDVSRPDYDFFDPRLNDFYAEIIHLVDVSGWTHGYGALSPALKFAREELSILEQLLPGIPCFDNYHQPIQRITSESNLDPIRSWRTFPMFSAGRANLWSVSALRSRSSGFTDRLIETRDEFILANQDLLLASCNPTPSQPMPSRSAPKGTDIPSHRPREQDLAVARFVARFVCR